MKFAYINCFSMPDGLLGIENKISQQATCAKMLGVNIDVYYINYKKYVDMPDVHFIPLKKYVFPPSLFRFGYLNSMVPLEKYDAIILRYSRGDFSTFSNVISKYGNKIITEHHTKEAEELALTDQNTVKRNLKVYMERALGNSFLKKTRGLIGVTDEITRHQLQRTTKQKFSTTIANGIDTINIRPIHYRPFDGKNLHVLFVASNFTAWQGLSRLAEGLSKFTSESVHIHVYLVGNIPKDQKCYLDAIHKKNVTLYTPGKLFGEKLDDICEKANIAIGSLAIHRKGLAEACTLKIREYAARGVPFLMGHPDTDIPKTFPYCLQIASDESPLDFGEIIDFLQINCDRPSISSEIRNFAEKKLDWEIKMQLLWDFLTHFKNYSSNC